MIPIDLPLAGGNMLSVDLAANDSVSYWRCVLGNPQIITPTAHWLELTGATGGQTCLTLHNAAYLNYQLLMNTNLSDPGWTPGQIISNCFRGDTNFDPVPTAGRPVIFSGRRLFDANR